MESARSRPLTWRRGRVGLLVQVSSRPVALALLPLLCLGIVAGARSLPGRAR
ncbi:hypothetical protein [Solihabitans fulvus]|uniref:hypothetical protein n=1 Tax=Solihabitans fulvus TaxID=1892852 RepID=UPI00166201D0|nr:hypothetical protein [Solihabitans fulvus]